MVRSTISLELEMWLNDFPRLEILLAHRNRSAQGAGPFHYDPQDTAKIRLLATLLGRAQGEPDKTTPC